MDIHGHSLQVAAIRHPVRDTNGGMLLFHYKIVDLLVLILKAQLDAGSWTGRWSIFRIEYEADPNALR